MPELMKKLMRSTTLAKASAARAEWSEPERAKVEARPSGDGEIPAGDAFFDRGVDPTSGFAAAGLELRRLAVERRR